MAPDSSQASSPTWERALWAVVALGLLASLLILRDRWDRETANRQVEMVLDYRTVADFARGSGRPVDEVLAELKGKGVTAVAVDEQTLDDLSLRGQARALRAIDFAAEMRRNPPRSLYDTRIPVPDGLFLETTDPALAEALAAQAEHSLGQGRARTWSYNGTEYVVLALDPRTANTTGLGIPEDLVRHLNADLGFRIWLRPENNPDLTAEEVEARLRHLASLPGVQGLIFAGGRNEAMGYPDKLEQVAALLPVLKLKLGVIELPDRAQQKGIETLARKATGQVTRVFAVSPAQQAKTHPESVVAMYSLGASERNLRVLYVRPYTDIVEELPAAQANQILFAGLQAELSPVLSDSASTFPEARTGGWLVAWALAAAAAAAGTVLLAGYVMRVPLWAAVLLGVLLVGGTLATAVTGIAAHQWRALMALGTATVFPVLGLVMQLPAIESADRRSGLGQVLLTATGVLLSASAVSLAGSLMAASFLPETPYMLALDVFRGVKLHSMLVPVLVLGVWMARQRSLEVFVRFLEEHIKVWHLVVLVVLAAMAAVYVARTGNVTGEFAVSDSERALRRWLDAALGVRPRFKEFVLGHPALMLAPVLAWLRWRGLVPFALLAAAVGQASLSDTYAHIHTPLGISLIRTAIGLGIGWGVGLVAALVLVAAKGWAAPLVDRLQKRAVAAESP